MSCGYTVSPAADRDLDAIADFLVDNGSLEIALDFLESAHSTFALLAAQPEMGWLVNLQTVDLVSARTFRVRNFEKVLIFYRPRVDTVEILRVLHGAQNLDALFESSDSPI